MDSAPSTGANSAAALTQRRARLGLPFFLLLLYPVFDYGRPPNPMGIPMVISILLAAAWFATPKKKVNLQIVCFILLLAGMVIGSITAFNIGSARQAASAMAIILLCICIPLIHIVDSLRKVRIFVNVLIVVFLYVGIWALFTGGSGPSGAAGGQDENYTSAMMCTAIPLAYFSIAVTTRRAVKLFYILSLGVFIAAVVISMSRGGFIGLIGATLFCVFYSPRRKQALVALAVGAFLVLVVAGPQYWEEMGTITDTKEATADTRLELWAIAWRMFAHNPVFGVGPGNFRWNAGTYQSAEQLDKFGRDLTYSILVHSTYFELLSELGLVGAALFATILIRTFRDLKRIRSGAHVRYAEESGSQPKKARASKEQEPSEKQQLRFYSLAIAGSLVGYLLPAAFVSFTYFSHFWLLTALAVALSEIARDPAKNSTATSNSAASAA